MSVGTAIIGMLRLYAMAFAVELPTRRPVYDPGPELTAIAPRSVGLIPAECNNSLMAGANLAVWFLPSSKSRKATREWSRLSATEQTAVEVSI
jgi:hypothetical protein